MRIVSEIVYQNLELGMGFLVRAIYCEFFVVEARTPSSWC